MNRAFLGLGSNVGDRLAYLRGALTAMESWPDTRIRRCSSLYETEYVGPQPTQRPYWNACVDLSTALTPEDLLMRSRDAERAAGREADTHMAPRSLDVDVLVFGQDARCTPQLQLPHPRMGQRRFVLEPLAEIAPTLVPPGWSDSVAQRLRDASIQSQDVDCIAQPDWWESAS